MGWSHQRLCIVDINFWYGFSAVHSYQSIQQLAKDEQLSFPKAEIVLMNKIYVDDILAER